MLQASKNLKEFLKISRHHHGMIMSRLWQDHGHIMARFCRILQCPCMKLQKFLKGHSKIMAKSYKILQEHAGFRQYHGRILIRSCHDCQPGTVVNSSSNWILATFWATNRFDSTNWATSFVKHAKKDVCLKRFSRRKCVRVASKLNPTYWTKDVAFYHDGVSFIH